MAAVRAKLTLSDLHSHDRGSRAVFRLEQNGRAAVVTLSRPPVNAINNEWIAGFGELLDRVDAHGETAVLHIRSDQKVFCAGADLRQRSEEHTSELQSLMRIPYAVFC